MLYEERQRLNQSVRVCVCVYECDCVCARVSWDSCKNSPFKGAETAPKRQVNWSVVLEKDPDLNHFDYNTWV